MLDDPSRRDVLAALASTAALPAVSEVDHEDDEQQHQELPDLADNHPFWVVLAAAALRGEPPEDTGHLMFATWTMAPRAMDAGEALEYVRAASRGDYDVDVLERRAATAWAGHSL